MMNISPSIKVDMNELTFVLRYTTLTATKMDLPEYKRLELPGVPIAQNRQLHMGVN